MFTKGIYACTIEKYVRTQRKFSIRKISNK